MNHRLIALIKKEFNQIRRDKRLAVSLIVPPTLQLLLFDAEQLRLAMGPALQRICVCPSVVVMNRVL